MPLLRAALRVKRHLVLVVATIITLFWITMANQFEMFALGAISNSGSQFFTQNRTETVDTSKSLSPLQKLTVSVKKNFSFNNNIRALIAILVGVAVFKAFALFFSRYTSQLLAIRISRDLRQHYFEHLQSLPMSFYRQYHSGSLSTRVVGDATQIALSLNSLITNYLQTPFILISTFSLCFFISWRLSIVIFFGLPLIVLPMILLARKVKTIAKQLLKNQERFAIVLIDFLAGIQTVKIFGMEPFSRKKYEEQNQEMAKLESKSAKYALMIRPIIHTITTVCLAVIIIFGLYVLKMSLPELIVFSGLLHLLYEPTKKFAEENANIQKGVAAAERMFEVLKLKSTITDHDGAIVLKQFNDKIEFDRVWFRYQDDWILKDVSFTVEKGQTVAIVGPTGGGKSTIVQLIPRLYEIDKGEIRIDGLSLSKYTQKSIREQVAFVAQKPFFFLDTIATNIAYGKPYSREKLVAAAKQAHADEFITRLDKGYDSELSEAGNNLSGGQQQRLAIARALVKNAPILILDEATSALDSISEKRIKETISDLQGKVTQIIIAHRLSTIEHADKIIYIEHGEKIAEGTKEELLGSCESFRHAYNAFHYQSSRVS